MGLQINQNVAALNAYRNLSVTDGQLSKSLERLSSGFRINRAADDAAGLAISEKLRGQVKGLNQAVANAQNGISLIQTAEGALNESHSILQRMRELAVQSANDTNTAADRGQIQKEVDQLSQELTRVSGTTEFNTKKLLDGSFSGATFQIGANAGQTLSVSIDDMSASALDVVGGAKFEASATITANDLADGTYSVQDNGGSGQFKMVDAKGNTVATSSDGGANFTTTDSGAATIAFDGNVQSGSVKVSGTAVTATATATHTGANKLDAGTYTLNGTDVLNDKGDTVGTWTGSAVSVTGGGTYTLGTKTLASGDSFTIGGVDVSTQGGAAGAIDVLDSALAKVSDQRSTLGAVQNRLDHTINNLNVAAENLTASESRIRDTDMAKEMTQFTRSQILSQAGTAMLAQANQIPQGVLRLLG